MPGVFVPEEFSEPLVNPQTTTLFRRTPYISPEEFNQAPTAVATNNLVPKGSELAQEQALASVIMRASDWLDLLCFHAAEGTLAASPVTETGWITPKPNGAVALICNFKPILAVEALAMGPGPTNLENVGSEVAQNLTIQGPIILVPGACSFGPTTSFPGGPVTTNGKVWAVWTYLNGYPHSYLAEDAKAGEAFIHVGPSVPGGSKMYGIYEGTQLTIHDGANTEVIVVQSVEGLKLNLGAGLTYSHTVPANPNSVRVSAIPWGVEQAAISLTSCLIKTRGTRAMVIPQTASSGPSHQTMIQAGGIEDFEIAMGLLKPYIMPYMRST